MTAKTLEEFIKEKARPMYQALEAGTGTQLTGSFALEAIAEATAAEILRVVYAWTRHEEPDSLRHRGEIETADKLVYFLEQYINSTNTEGGE